MNRLPLILIFLVPTLLSAQEKTWTFPDPYRGWQDFTLREGVAQINRGDGPAFGLEENEYRPQDTEDLLLHFNQSGEGDASGRYAVLKPFTLAPARSARRGEGAAAFQNRDDGMELQGGPDSLFAPNRVWQDFSLEFWLYPATVQDGETIFLWKGTDRIGRDFIPQEVRVSLQGRRILWRFDRFFQGTPAPIVLQGTSPLLPRTWRHHLIRFDSNTGLLEYLVDGRPEASTHVTPTGEEEKNVWLPRVGSASQSIVSIGPNLSALVDEFRLAGTVADPSLSRYGRGSAPTAGPEDRPANAGFLRTRILDLGSSGSALSRIEAKLSVPGATGLRFSYRISEGLKYRWHPEEGTTTSLDTSAPWIPLQPGIPLVNPPRGRYVELQVDFLDDGTGAHTPLLRELKVMYDQNQPPAPPGGLVAQGENGKVTLFWKPVTRDRLQGYRIYWGTSPRNYTQWVDAGKVTSYAVEGLKNLQLYYFAVVSLDTTQPEPLLSRYSEEVSARPEGTAP